MVSVDVVPVGVDPAAVDRLGQHVVDLDDLGLGQRIVRLQPGQLDDLADQVGQPGGLDPHPASRTGAPPAGRRPRPRPPRPAARWRRSGVFSSWLVLAMKSRRVSSTRRAVVSSSASTTTRSSPSGATCTTRYVVAARRPAVDLEVLRSSPAVPTYVADQIQQLGRRRSGCRGPGPGCGPRRSPRSPRRAGRRPRLPQLSIARTSETPSGTFGSGWAKASSGSGAGACDGNDQRADARRRPPAPRSPAGRRRVHSCDPRWRSRVLRPGCAGHAGRAISVRDMFTPRSSAHGSTYRIHLGVWLEPTGIPRLQARAMIRNHNDGDCIDARLLPGAAGRRPG